MLEALCVCSLLRLGANAVISPESRWRTAHSLQCLKQSLHASGVASGLSALSPSNNANRQQGVSSKGFGLDIFSGGMRHADQNTIVATAHLAPELSLLSLCCDYAPWRCVSQRSYSTCLGSASSKKPPCFLRMARPQRSLPCTHARRHLQ